MRVKPGNLTVSIAVSFCLFILPQAETGEVQKAKGQISVGIHKFSPKAGEVYLVRVTGKGFEPNVSVFPGYLGYMPRDFSKPEIYKGFYVANDSKEQSVFITAKHYGLKGTGPFSYELEVRRMEFASKLLLDVNSSLTATDPVYKRNKRHYKAYKISLEAKRFYKIELRRAAAPMDPYLYLENSRGDFVRSDDDGLGDRNSMILYSPRKSGEYRIIVTTLGRSIGKYSLKVLAQK